MFITAFKSLFNVIVSVFLVAVVLVAMTALAAGHVLGGILLLAGGFIVVLMMFGMCSIFIDMHEQLLKTNAILEKK